ncbi:MAG: antibiotic biosynthesis monooxygenase [Chloroflexi bacterium]|nr:antibiotic biosynthesis monooxygenase [Chloroflexota bacterium]
MIVRLVSLKVDKERIEEFRKHFEGIYEDIKAHQGCLYLQLVRDLEGLGEYFTISVWESLEALENYRNGPFFKDTWPKVKTFLREKAWAQSFEVILDDNAPRLLNQQMPVSVGGEGI